MYRKHLKVKLHDYTRKCTGHCRLQKNQQRRDPDKESYYENKIEGLESFQQATIDILMS